MDCGRDVTPPAGLKSPYAQTAARVAAVLAKSAAATQPPQHQQRPQFFGHNPNLKSKELLLIFYWLSITLCIYNKILFYKKWFSNSFFCEKCKRILTLCRPDHVLHTFVIQAFPISETRKKDQANKCNIVVQLNMLSVAGSLVYLKCSLNIVVGLYWFWCGGPGDQSPMLMMSVVYSKLGWLNLSMYDSHMTKWY